MAITDVRIINRDYNFNPEIHKKDTIKPPSDVPYPVKPAPLLFIEDTTAPAEDPDQLRDEVLRDKRQKNFQTAIEAVNSQRKSHPGKQKIKLPFNYDTLQRVPEEDDLQKEILAYNKPRPQQTALASVVVSQAVVAATPVQVKPIETKKPEDKTKKSSGPSSAASSSTEQVKLGPKPILAVPAPIDDSHHEILDEMLAAPEQKKRKRDSDSSIDSTILRSVHEQREIGNDMTHINMDEVNRLTLLKKSMRELIDFYQDKINEHMKQSTRLDWVGKLLALGSIFFAVGIFASVVATGGVSALFVAFAAAVGLAGGIINFGNGVLKLQTQNLVGKSTAMKELRELQQYFAEEFLKECYSLITRLHHLWQLSIDLVEHRKKAQKVVSDI